MQDVENFLLSSVPFSVSLWFINHFPWSFQVYHIFQCQPEKVHGEMVSSKKQVFTETEDFTLLWLDSGCRVFSSVCFRIWVLKAQISLFLLYHRSTKLFATFLFTFWAWFCWFLSVFVSLRLKSNQLPNRRRFLTFFLGSFQLKRHFPGIIAEQL